MADTLRSLRATIRQLTTDHDILVAAIERNTAHTQQQLTAKQVEIDALKKRLNERVNPMVQEVFKAHAQSMEALAKAVSAIQNY